MQGIDYQSKVDKAGRQIFFEKTSENLYCYILNINISDCFLVIKSI